MASQEAIDCEWISITVSIKCECGKSIILAELAPYEERACHHGCGRTYHVSGQVVRKTP